jgi:acetyl esterase/lipase
VFKLLVAAAAISIPFLIAACGGLAFTAANAPAWFGDFERDANRAYGADERQRLDVYTPPGASGRPIIVFWYGGSWEKGRKSQYRFVGAALAEAGFVTVIPDYRLYPEVKFPAFVDDGAAALAWVVSNAAAIGGDAQRIYLAGHSAGAQLAGLLAYDSARLEKHGLARDTVKGFIGLSGPYALNPDTAKLHAIFGKPYQLADWQPTQHVKPGAPPALLLHGEADRVVWVSHAREMSKALTAAGVPVTLVTYPGRGHRDTVAALTPVAPDTLPVLAEIQRFVGGEMRDGVATAH